MALPELLSRRPCLDSQDRPPQQTGLRNRRYER